MRLLQLIVNLCSDAVFAKEIARALFITATYLVFFFSVVCMAYEFSGSASFAVMMDKR